MTGPGPKGTTTGQRRRRSRASVPSAAVIHQLTNQVVTAGYRQAFLVAAWIAFGGFVIALATIRVAKPDAQSVNPLAL